MKRFTEFWARILANSLAALLLLAPAAYAQIQTNTGTLPDGATFLIQVPPNWNGTLFLYSHGYVVPGSLNPALDVGDPATGAAMLQAGYALAGSSYATTGWAIEQALPDQIAVLDVFKSLVGKPKRTIAWGHSLGGIITAGLIQRYPERFDAALPMCGVLSGGVATWNNGLDGAFAFKTLLAPGSPLQLVKISGNPLANFGLALSILNTAQQQGGPQAAARIALSAALGDTPGWFTPLSAEPARTNVADQELNQYLWDANVDFPFGFAFRAELEARAGGNVSWNTGVDYRKQFAKSADRNEVIALYKAAGLDLEADLDTLNDAPRISADPNAVKYLAQNISFDGQIEIPVLTMHTTGDGLVVPENESAYKDVVDEAGNQRLLRQTFVHRAGHCAFTPAETVTAATNLIDRLDTGKWPPLDDAILN
jgi:pimeloyl-ACP methyl ester carboxylesterase